MRLSEWMRIKAEGDYAAIKALVDKYGVDCDPKLRDQVVARYARLDVPTYRCGVNSELTAKLDAAGEVTAVTIGYPRGYGKQQLGYAGLYGVQ
jgi:dipeptidyl-peptidase-3